MALLCLMTLVIAVASLRDAAPKPTQTVRADAVVQGPSPPPEAAAREASPPTAAVSLGALAREAQVRATTSTTRARTTDTTRKATTTTITPRAPTTTRVASPAPSTTTPLTPLTTLLESVSPPAAAVAGALTRSDSGIASWFNAPGATCAHRTLPLGTTIKVTRTSNGASATCRVNDRGPTVATGRLIDLSLDTFQKLAAKEAGLIDVTIEW